VGFLAYLGMFPPLLPIVADQPSVAMGYPDTVRRDVASARQKADLLVISLHAGREMTLQPSSRQKGIAHAAAEAGADIIIGHHPHIVQPSERYRGVPILYSLGNFVFDPSPSVRRRPNGPWSAMCIADLGPGRTVKARLAPLLIVDRQPRHRTPSKPHPRGL
jgi:poly-gamma-glutamate synthesis protein (capsule biosynthesis protein)